MQGGGNVHGRTMLPIGRCFVWDSMGLFGGVRTFPPQFLVLIYEGSCLWCWYPSPFTETWADTTFPHKSYQRQPFNVFQWLFRPPNKHLCIYLHIVQINCFQCWAQNTINASAAAWIHHKAAVCPGPDLEMVPRRNNPPTSHQVSRFTCFKHSLGKIL